MENRLKNAAGMLFAIGSNQPSEDLRLPVAQSTDYGIYIERWSSARQKAEERGYAIPTLHEQVVKIIKKV